MGGEGTEKKKKKKKKKTLGHTIEDVKKKVDKTNELKGKIEAKMSDPDEDEDEDEEGFCGNLYSKYSPPEKIETSVVKHVLVNNTWAKFCFETEHEHTSKASILHDCRYLIIFNILCGGFLIAISTQGVGAEYDEELCACLTTGLSDVNEDVTCNAVGTAPWTLPKALPPVRPQGDESYLYKTQSWYNSSSYFRDEWVSYCGIRGGDMCMASKVFDNPANNRDMGKYRPEYPYQHPTLTCCYAYLNHKSGGYAQVNYAELEGEKYYMAADSECSMHPDRGKCADHLKDFSRTKWRMTSTAAALVCGGKSDDYAELDGPGGKDTTNNRPYDSGTETGSGGPAAKSLNTYVAGLISKFVNFIFGRGLFEAMLQERGAIAGVGVAFSCFLIPMYIINIVHVNYGVVNWGPYCMRYFGVMFYDTIIYSTITCVMNYYIAIFLRDAGHEKFGKLPEKPKPKRNKSKGNKHKGSKDKPSKVDPRSAV